MRRILLLTTAAAALGASAAPVAHAAATPASLPLVKRSVTAKQTATTYRAPMSGFLTVRTAGVKRGDWDLDLVDRRTGRKLGASHGFTSREVVQAYVSAGQRIVARTTRRSGTAKRLRVSFKLFDLRLPKVDGIPQLVSVSFRDNEDLERIEKAGLDLTHHIHDGQADVIVTGAKQLAALKALGLPFEIEVANLNKQFARARLADRRYAASRKASPLPSGRETYRVLQDYQDELKALVDENPGLVKPVVLPKKTFQGREISGVEIARDVERTDDGRPTYFVMGMHHAREWPSAEAAMELAHMLVQGADSDARIKSLLERERIVIVPIVNVDGFVESREGGALGIPDPADTTGIAALQTVEGVVMLGGSFAYRRKNCNGAIPNPSVPCTLQYGIDPNRNYGNGWGGPGAGTDPITQSYRGTGPFSEPETQAVWEYSRERQVTNLITIHNVAALVLRPPGLHDAGKAPDEVAMKELGDAMGAAAGYTSQYSFQLYDTSGTTDDYTYAAQGGYAYTIEIGPAGGQFHMPYQTGVVDEWTGKEGTPTEGKGLREALLLAAENAADPAHHAVITGRAAKGHVLRIKKEFRTETSEPCAYAQGYINSSGLGGTPVDCVGRLPKQSFADKVESTMTVPQNGKFEWHVNPSTRPFVGHRFEGGTATPVGEPQTFTAADGENKHILGAVDSETGGDEGSVEREFTLDGTADAIQIDLQWDLQPEDFDLEVYRVLANGDRQQVGNSGKVPGAYEQVVLPNPEAGTYVLKIIYYATVANDWTATVQPLEADPERVVPTGESEAFTLTCETPDGTVLSSQEVTIWRGERLEVNPACGGSTGADGGNSGGGQQGGGGGSGGGSAGGGQSAGGTTGGAKPPTAGSKPGRKALAKCKARKTGKARKRCKAKARALAKCERKKRAKAQKRCKAKVRKRARARK